MDARRAENEYHSRNPTPQSFVALFYDGGEQHSESPGDCAAIRDCIIAAVEQRCGRPETLALGPYGALAMCNAYYHTLHALMEELLPGTPHRLKGWWASGCGDDPVERGVRTDVEMSERQRERDAEATTEESEEELNEEEVGALPRACVRACVQAGLLTAVLII